MAAGRVLLGLSAAFGLVGALAGGCAALTGSPSTPAASASVASAEGEPEAGGASATDAGGTPSASNAPTSATPMASSAPSGEGTTDSAQGSDSDGPGDGNGASSSPAATNGKPGGQAAGGATRGAKPAKGDISFALVGTAGGIPKVDSVLRAQVAPGVRRCYQKGLAADPSQSGELIVAMQVDSNGSVGTSRVVVNRGISQAVEKCSATLAGRAHFPAFGGDAGKSTATLTVRLTFALAK